MAMDAFSASLMADKREIIFAPTVYKFQTFAQMAEEFQLNERDVVLTNEFIYTPFMKELGLKCSFVFQEKFGAGEPSEAMIQTMYDAIPYDSYDRVIAVGGGAIMDLCKLLGCKRPDTVHNLYFKRFPVQHRTGKNEIRIQVKQPEYAVDDAPVLRSRNKQLFPLLLHDPAVEIPDKAEILRRSIKLFPEEYLMIV